MNEQKQGKERISILIPDTGQFLIRKDLHLPIMDPEADLELLSPPVSPERQARHFMRLIGFQCIKVLGSLGEHNGDHGFAVYHEIGARLPQIPGHPDPNRRLGFVNADILLSNRKRLSETDAHFISETLSRSRDYIRYIK